MEVVGLVAAVGSIAKAGCVAIKFASTIRQVAKEAGTVGQRIERTSHMFQTFGKAIKAAEISMQHHCPQTVGNSEDSPAVKYMKENDFLRSLQRQSCMIRNEIFAHEKVIWSVITEWGPRVWREFKTSWNWVEMEQQIMNLHPQMESVKSTMTMTLHIITLEVAVAKNKSHPSMEQEEEIQYLKTKIDELIDDMRYLRETLAHMQVPVYAWNSSERYLYPQVDPLKVICHLGYSLVESGTIPTEPPESFSFKEAKRSRQYRRRHSRQFQSTNPLEVPAPARHEQVVQPRSSGTSSPGPLPSSPHPQKTESNSPNTRPLSPYRYRREGLYRYRREADRLQPVDTARQDHDLSDSESRSRRTGSPRQSILTVKEGPTPREDHSTDIPDTKRRISRVADVVEMETPPKDERPTLKPLRPTESAQDARGEINNARTRRAIRKQRQSSATVANPDISARYGNVKPRLRPRSPPNTVEDTRSEMDHNPARKLKSPTTVDKLDDPSGSETLKRRSQGPPKGVIDPRDAGGSDPASSLIRTKEKQNTQPRPLDIPLNTEPTPPPTPISPTQPSPIVASSSSSTSSSSSSRTRRTPVVPQPRRQPPSPSGQPPSASQTRKSSAKNEIETAYIINPKTLIKTPFEVHIDRKHIKNLITQSYARKLGIGIVYQAHREVFQYHGTKITLIGSARLQWSTVPGNTFVEPGSVEVTVCEDSEDLEHPVIFGQWFVGARKNLSREESKEGEEGLDVE